MNGMSTTLDSSEIIAEITAFRRRLHQEPELSGQEKDTSAALVSELEREGFAPRTFIDHRAVVALWPGKDRSRALALRADMDALPLQEQSGMPWTSQRPGIMHACGHDGHASLMLGVAKSLARRGKAYPCDIALLFQPAEENGQGAPALIKDGFLEGPPRIEALFGLHGWPELPVGKLAVHDTSVMASVDNFDIVLHGKGGHGAMPHQGFDPITAAAHFITAAQTLISRRLSPLHAGVLTFGSIKGGKAHNVIPSECQLKGTIRAMTPETRQMLKDGLQNLVLDFPPAFGCKGALTWVESTPATLNNPAMAALVKSAVTQALGNEALEEIPPSMGGEDFSYFLEKVPGAYFWLGVGDGQGLLHNPRYDFNDAAFAPGLRVFETLIERYFHAHP